MRIGREDAVEAQGDKSSFKALALKARARIKRSKGLSKTKIAILQARLKNIERQRRARKYWGGSL